MDEVVSMVEGLEDTRLVCVRGPTGGATVAGGCVGGGESGFRGAKTEARTEREG